MLDIVYKYLVHAIILDFWADNDILCTTLHYTQHHKHMILKYALFSLISSVCHTTPPCIQYHFGFAKQEVVCVCVCVCVCDKTVILSSLMSVIYFLTEFEDLFDDEDLS